jgi:hypothetical protein
MLIVIGHLGPALLLHQLQQQLHHDGCFSSWAALAQMPVLVKLYIC